MQPTENPGYELCYVGARPQGPVSTTLPSSSSSSGDAPWLAWGRSAFAVAVVVVLVTLGIANVAMYSRWHEVEDGVLWGARPEGVVALDVLAHSPAAQAGVERGDVLLAVNGSPVESPADAVEYQHRSRAGTRLRY